MPGDCHYLEGNLQAQRRVDFTKKLLKEIGLKENRIRMVNVSAAMGAKFAEIAKEFTEEIIELGPNPLRRKEIEE